MAITIEGKATANMDVDLVCDSCGADLDSEQIETWNSNKPARVGIKPCKGCIEKAKKEAGE